MAFVKNQLVFIDRTVWLSDTESVQRVNEPVLFDCEEDIPIAGHTYTRWWFIDADGSRECVQGFGGEFRPKTVEEVFGFKPEL